MKRERINYVELNARQKESYNFAKLASVLADYGYTSVRLHDDYHSGDLLAIRPQESHYVQLKGRLTVDKKYVGRGLYIAWPTNNSRDRWYLIEHDELVDILRENTTYLETQSWKTVGAYSSGKVSRHLLGILSRFEL